MTGLQIVPLEPEDAPAVHALLTHADLAPWLDVLPWEMSERLIKRFGVVDHDERLHRFAAWQDGTLLGVAELHVSGRQRYRHSAELWLAVHPTWQRRGVGKRLLTTLLDLADRWLNVVRLESHVHTDNRAAAGLLEAHGFAVEVVRRQDLLRDGALVDTATWGRLRADTPTALLRPLPASPRDTPVTVRLRHPSLDDAAALAAIHRAEAVVWGTLQLTSGSAALWKARLQMLDPAHHALLVAECDGRVVAFGGIHGGPGPRRAHKLVVGMGVHPDFHGRGVGGQLLAALIQLAENDFGTQRLELDVYADNTRARRLYAQHGFVEEGVIRCGGFGGGGFLDSVVMSRLRR